MGFRSSPDQRSDFAVRDRRMEMARKPRVTARCLDNSDLATKHHYQTANEFWRIKLFCASGCTVTCFLRNAPGAHRSGGVHRRRHGGHELSKRTRCEDEYRRYRQRGRISVSVEEPVASARAKLSSRCCGYRGRESWFAAIRGN